MSNNYLPTPLPGVEEHLRYYRATLSRPYGDDRGQPVVSFTEEHVLEDANGKQTEPRGSVSSAISDTNEETEFDIINPGTLQPTGQTMTYAQVVQALDSLYYHLAVLRDTVPSEP